MDQGLDPFEGTRAAQEALGAASQAERTAIREAFTAAGQKRASVLAEGVKNLARSVRQNFRQNFNPATAPKAASLTDQLSNFEKAFPGRVKFVNVRTLESYRQQVMALTRSSDPIERAAAQNIRKSFDEFMDGAIDNALVRGDTEAIEAFAKARGLRREFGKKFEGDAILEKLISEADGTLLLEPSEATRYLFGATKLGGKTGATKALRRIKGILGADSPEWKGLREEAFLRLFPDDAVTIGKFPGAFDKALKESPELMGELFTKTEIKTLRRFRNVIANVTQKAPGAVNFSNTTAALSRLAQDVFGNSGTILSFIARLPIVKDLATAGRNAVNRQRARAAVGLGPIAAGQAIGTPVGLTGTLGSVAAVDDRDPAIPNPNNLAAALRQGPALKARGRDRQGANRALMIGP